jgi:hypothetical protein
MTHIERDLNRRLQCVPSDMLRGLHGEWRCSTDALSQSHRFWHHLVVGNNTIDEANSICFVRVEELTG